MANDLVLVNKKTGEKLVLKSKSQPDTENKVSGDIFEQRRDKVNKAIQERGNLVGGIIEDYKSPNILRKGLGALKTVGAPFTAAESAIANPALMLQNPQKMYENAKSTSTIGVLGEGLGNLVKESYLGITGQKQGQFGDVYRVAGAKEPVAATAGLGTSMISPAGALSAIKKSFGSVYKMTDKNLLETGQKMVSAIDSAMTDAGKNLDNAYNYVDVLKINPSDLIDEISKLPKPLLNKLESAYGSLEDFAMNATVGTLRKLTGSVGKYKPGSFSKDTKGLLENLADEEISMVYAGLKKVRDNTVKQTFGQKAVDELTELDKAFSEVVNAGRDIKNTIIDPVTKKATKAGVMARDLDNARDITTRESLNTLRKSGKEAQKKIDSVISSLKKFNRIQSVSRVAKHALSAATYGGAIGAVGGAIGGNLIRRATNPND